jgi:hypothetical protein
MGRDQEHIQVGESSTERGPLTGAAENSRRACCRSAGQISVSVGYQVARALSCLRAAHMRAGWSLALGGAARCALSPAQREARCARDGREAGSPRSVSRSSRGRSSGGDAGDHWRPTGTRSSVWPFILPALRAPGPHGRSLGERPQPARMLAGRASPRSATPASRPLPWVPRLKKRIRKGAAPLHRSAHGYNRGGSAPCPLRGHPRSSPGRGAAARGSVEARRGRGSTRQGVRTAP